MDVSQYLEIFIDETEEHLQTLSDCIMELEKEPENMDTINEIFRAAHSLKGMAGTMGFKRMQRLTHDMENVFQEVRSDKVKVNSNMIDLLFKCLDAIESYLAPEGYRILKAYDGIQAIEMMRKNDIQLLIMDVMMPRMDGIRATLKIREESNIPIIILSAKTEDTDKIFGLNVGADDYVTKPFNSLELVARVKSQLRRYTKLGTMMQEPTSNVYKTGGLEINDDMKQVTVDGIVVEKLTPIQYNILLFLTKNKGRVFSIEQIYENIWNEDAINADNTVAVHIRHIREKIEINPKEPRYLKVVWGIGYKMEDIKVE